MAELAVEACLDSARRIAIAQRYRVLRAGAHLDVQAIAVLRAREGPMPRAIFGFLPPRTLDTIECENPALISQHRQSQQRRPQRPQFEPRAAAFQKRALVIVETAHLPPRIGVGMTLSPIVVLAADPVFDGDAFAVHEQMTVEPHQRTAYQRLGFGKTA